MLLDPAPIIPRLQGVIPERRPKGEQGVLSRKMEGPSSFESYQTWKVNGRSDLCVSKGDLSGKDPSPVTASAAWQPSGSLPAGLPRWLSPLIFTGTQTDAVLVRKVTGN